jgi:hypothetical protein
MVLPRRGIKPLFLASSAKIHDGFKGFLKQLLVIHLIHSNKDWQL